MTLFLFTNPYPVTLLLGSFPSFMRRVFNRISIEFFTPLSLVPATPLSHAFPAVSVPGFGSDNQVLAPKRVSVFAVLLFSVIRRWANAAKNVLPMRYLLKMVGVNAPLVSAEMIARDGRFFSTQFPVDPTMSLPLASPPKKDTITLSLDGELPPPAWSLQRPIDLAPPFLPGVEFTSGVVSKAKTHWLALDVTTFSVRAFSDRSREAAAASAESMSVHEEAV